MNITIGDISFQEDIIQNWVNFFSYFLFKISKTSYQFQDKDLLVYSILGEKKKKII